METEQDGMEASLSCKKLVPLIKEDIKDGIKETRHLVLNGDFHIFVKGMSKPIKLPVKLEFKDEPSTVELVQTALNIQNIGEKCLLSLHSNKYGRLDEYQEGLESKELKQQQLFAETDADSD